MQLTIATTTLTDFLASIFNTCITMFIWVVQTTLPYLITAGVALLFWKVGVWFFGRKLR